MLGLSVYLLFKYHTLFPGIKNKWLRQNLAVQVIGFCFMLSFLGISSEVVIQTSKVGIAKALLQQLIHSIVIVAFVFNVVWLVSRWNKVQNLSFVKRHIVIILTIIIAAEIIYTAINYVTNGMKFSQLGYALTFAFYNACATGLIYTALNYADLDRKRKLNEKELELERLNALKTKAELDALHSKVNPHFLYNALNSIADLSITDGKKARKMTIALADLFRYSINYSNNNYSTIADELEMAAVYLEIEKIRFEDKLNYTIDVDEAARYYLVPRFLLQPLVENAVKHGLKATAAMTTIAVSIQLQEEAIEIIIRDTGPAFPEELNPGYGLKSVYDKLDLLFPNAYELHLTNHPEKQLSILIKQKLKNEPAA